VYNKSAETAIIIFVQITPPANLQSWWLTISCKDGAVAKYCQMELSVWLLPYQFFCPPCPLSVFHTQKAPSPFFFDFHNTMADLAF
jgi:type IV secretory pathway VirB4 component